MKTEDVRFVTVSPDTGKVFVALKNGKNVIRKFSVVDALAANKTIRDGGLAARIEFVVNLINTKYMKFEKPKPCRCVQRAKKKKNTSTYLINEMYFEL